MFDTPADIRVNTVNCVGVMGAGVALAFKQRFPEMYRDYKRECELGRVRPGELHVWKNLSGDWIINFPTKRHWREKSRYEDIESGLVALREYLAQLGKVRVTLPALGSGHGGLDWSRVSKMIQKHLEGLEAEIIVFDPADSRTIADSEVPGVGPETRVLAKGTPDFPNALTGFDCDEIYYQGDLTILKNADLTIALSSKPNQKEETAAIESIGELPTNGITICLVLGNATATTLAGTALDNGNRVAAWVPQGLSQYRPPKALRIAPRCNNLLLLSLAKPQQSWNPRLADRTRLASLLTSRTALITDPEPRWLRNLVGVRADGDDTKIFYIRYQALEALAEKDLRLVSAKPIGRGSGTGKPNLMPILDLLGSMASEESVVDVPKPRIDTTTALEDSIETQHEYPALHQEQTLTRYPKRLIEVDLPIKRISAHARREKSIRPGHISTLHIWWARRPLAACRAVICAALWPDPADPFCPESFREAARTLMREWAKDHKELLGKESFGRFVKLQRNPGELDDVEKLRAALLDFIADFANWDNSDVPEYLDTSRALTQAAHEALGGAHGTRPLVVDPFAGGGSIPLEALRVGADAFASDLNPVPVLLNKIVLEYNPKYGQRLADEVSKWAEWAKREAEKELAELYPKEADGATPIAYLWARTIQCEGPACGTEVPLIRNMQITRSGKFWHFSFAETDAKTVSVSVESNKRAVHRPTVAGGSVTCPRKSCGYTTPAKAVRAQLVAKQGGANDARLLAVYMDRAGQRFFRDPNESDIRANDLARIAVGREKLPQDTINPIRPYKNTRGLSAVTRIGITRFCDLYTARQALVITTFQHILLRLPDFTNDAEFRRAVLAILNCAVGRFIFQNCSLSRWNAARSTIEGAFGKQALQVVWDFAEVNPLSDGPANWNGAIAWILKVLKANACLPHLGTVLRGRAQDQLLPADAADALITDPPYFAAIPYGDLSNVFLVWERDVFRIAFPDLFNSGLVRQEDEIVVTNANLDADGNPKTPQFYQREMVAALKAARVAVKPHGIGVVVFAESSTASWEVMLGAVIEAGWLISGSWPIDTELQNRTQAAGSASLQSSIHIVCRPRENPDGSLRTDEIGNWSDVLQELPRRTHEWMPRLAEEGVVGADAIFACLGPALEIFSRYSSVEKASGDPVTLSEYLEYVWAAVAKEALAMIFEGADTTGFEEDARLTAMWLWTLSAGKATENGHGAIEEESDDESEGIVKKAKAAGFVIEYDAARKIAQGLGAHLEALDSVVQVRGETARLLPVAERARFLFGKQEEESPKQRKKKKPQIPLFDASKIDDEEDGGFRSDFTRTTGDTVLDRVHQSMILFGAGRSEALKRFLVEDGAGRDQRLWRLAQALAALYPSGTDERRWVEGVLARKKSLGF
jgi:adenine-specific DNA methylase/O-acetyl-ADP-ribose deacetylase (regulator of RNase III)